MINISLDTDFDVLAAFVETAQQAPEAMRRIGGEIARGPEAQDLIRDLSFVPTKPRYPLVWTSERQRKYVMAKLKREGNLPYQRTGDMARGWNVVLSAPGEISVTNTVPGAEFVYGPYPFRQAMHGITGWPFAPVVIARHEGKIQDALITRWLKYNGVR